MIRTVEHYSKKKQTSLQLNLFDPGTTAIVYIKLWKCNKTINIFGRLIIQKKHNQTLIST